MNKNTYSKTSRKKSFASLFLAFLLTLTFNSSPILLLSNNLRTASAYKSSDTKTYYTSKTNESETKFSDPNYPSSYKEYFSDSSKNFNLFKFYNEKFEEYHLSLAHEFFKKYTVDDYNTKYQEFLDAFGSKDLADFYSSHKNDNTLKATLKVETVTVRKLIEHLGISGFKDYEKIEVNDELVSKTLPAISTNKIGKFVNLSNFYRLFANYTIDKNINSVEEDRKKDEQSDGLNSTNLDIATEEAFYQKPSYQDKQDNKIVGNTHYNRIVDKIESLILDSAPAYAFDRTTQDTNVAAIFSNMTPTSVSYNYISNSYNSYNVPSVSYKTNKSSSTGTEKRTVYYFGNLETIQSSAADFIDYLYCSSEGEKSEDDILMYRPILPGEHGYLSNFKTYYRYSSSPYLTTSSKKDVYVLTENNASRDELDTIASLYFKQLTKSTLSENKDYYIQIPYETDELYFKAIYNNLYVKDGIYGQSSDEKFETFVSYFTETIDENKIESKLYLRIGSTPKKYVYIDKTKLNALKSEKPDYAHLDKIQTFDTTADDYVADDYYEIIENSNNASYFVKSENFKLYFLKNKEYYTEKKDPTYSTTEYEETYAPSIPLEKTKIASTKYEMDELNSSERKIYILSESTEKTETVDGKTFEVVNQTTIDENPNFFVKVPSYIYIDKGITDTHKLYYKHTEVETTKLYIVDDAESASTNKVYKTLNYNVIKSSELEANITSFVAVKSTDANYNKNFQLYYKHERTIDANNNQIYILNYKDLNLGTSSLKVIEKDELSDYVLLDREKYASDYEEYRKALVNPIADFQLYKKLTNVFVQNELKGGNAVFVMDSTSISSDKKEKYQKLLYTPVTQKEIESNPDLYVLIDSNDSNYLDDYKLYYKYQTETTPSRVVCSYDDINQTTDDFSKLAYELITEDNALPGDYKEGQELYYKKKLIKTNYENVSKPTFYYYQTTSTTTLSANSYYVISFYVSTHGDNAKASFIVKDTAKMMNTININNIDTNGVWEKYYIFLSTNADTASTINLYLYLGDEVNGIKGDNSSATTISGSVFFDDIKITKIGLSDFNKYSIDDMAIYSENNLLKESSSDQSGDGEGNEPTPANEEKKYADSHNNRAIIANLDSRFSSNNFDAKSYLDNSIKVFNSENGTKWNDIFDFDNASLQNFLGKEAYSPSTEENGEPNIEKIANKLTAPSANSDGFDMYDSNFNALWRYYISRDLKNDFSITKYINSYTDGKLEVTTTNKIEESEDPKKDEDEKEDSKKEESTDIKYVSSPFNANNYALKLKNTSKDTALGITSNSFTVKQFEYYKVSLWIYSPDLEGKATISVNSILTDRQHPVYGSLLSASVSSTYANVENSSAKNAEYGWIPVTLFIEGNNFQDMECFLVLTAEKDCTVYFDNIRIEKTTSTQYDSAKSNSSSNKYTTALSLTPKSSLISSDLTNGTFDYVKETSTTHDVTSEEPYTADNWTALTTNSKRAVAGVVSLQQSAFFNKYSKDSQNNVIIPKEYETDISNIFAIHAPSTVTAFDDSVIGYKHTYSIYSASLSLSSNSLYKISFKFFKNDNFNGTLFSRIYSSAVKSANVISYMEIDSESIDDETWETLTFYIATSTSSQTVYLEIGVQEAQGTCFFKNASAKKLSGKTIDSVIQSEASKLGITDQSTETLYDVFKTIKFLNLANSDFSHHSIDKNPETNMYDPKSFTNKSDITKDHTAGKIGVTVANYFDTVNHTIYSVTINKTTYYIGEVYELNIEDTKYYIHKTYDSANNSFNYKLYSDAELTNEITEINGTEIEIKVTESVKVSVGATTYDTATTYRLYKFADLREEVKTISGSEVSVPNLENVILGKGAHATENAITSTQKTSYVYNFSTPTTKDYEIGNSIISANELKNAQSGNVMILSNSHSSDYVTVTQASARTIGKSAFNVLRIYVKTSDFARDDIGLNISVDAVNVSWTNIDTTEKKSLADKYGFVCYEILVASNSTDSISNFAVTFSLGNTKDSDTGYAIISKISLDSFANQAEFDHYSSLISDDQENVKKAIYTNDSSKKDEEEKPVDDENSMSWATFFYIFSSILLVATLAVAMVAVFLKKHPIKGAEKFENEHDRDIQTTNSKSSKSSPRSLKSAKSKKDEIVIEFSENNESSTKSDGGII